MNSACPYYFTKHILSLYLKICNNNVHPFEKRRAKDFQMLKFCEKLGRFLNSNFWHDI